MGWRRELSPAPCASRSQQWSHRSLRPWSLRGRTRWRCRSRLLRWERRTGELRCPFHTDPRPVCGICGGREERGSWWAAALKGNTINNNMSAAFSTCEWRRSCHMTSCPETVQSSPAGKTPGRHWCWRKHPAAGPMFLQTERTGHVVSPYIRCCIYQTSENYTWENISGADQAGGSFSVRDVLFQLFKQQAREVRALRLSLV